MELLPCSAVCQFCCFARLPVTAASKQDVLQCHKPFRSGDTTQEASSNSLSPLALCHTFTFILANVLRDDRLLRIIFLQCSPTSKCPDSMGKMPQNIVEKPGLLLLFTLHACHPEALADKQCVTKPSSPTIQPMCNLQLTLHHHLGYIQHKKLACKQA